MKREMDSRNGDGDGADDMITIPFVMLIPTSTVPAYKLKSRKIKRPAAALIELNKAHGK
jgi:hypothetical protein